MINEEDGKKMNPRFVFCCFYVDLYYSISVNLLIKWMIEGRKEGRKKGRKGKNGMEKVGYFGCIYMYTLKVYLKLNARYFIKWIKTICNKKKNCVKRALCIQFGMLFLFSFLESQKNPQTHFRRWGRPWIFCFFLFLFFYCTYISFL